MGGWPIADGRMNEEGGGEEEATNGHEWIRMECTGKMPVLRECGGSMMCRMLRLLLGGKGSLPIYGSVARGAGRGGSAGLKNRGK